MMNEESGIIQFTDILSDEEFDELENLLYRPKWGYTHKSTADDKWRRWRMELADDPFFTELFFKKIENLTGKSFPNNFFGFNILKVTISFLLSIFFTSKSISLYFLPL